MNDVGLLEPRHRAIRASAGTGKTYQLTRRYLSLIARGVDPKEILATTFTRKAAAEITGRVIGRLAEAVLSADKLEELRLLVGEPTLTESDACRLFDRLVDELPRLRIGTLDKIFNSLARPMSFRLGLPPGWSISDQTQEQVIRARAIRQLFEAQGNRAVAEWAKLLFKGESARSVYEEIDSIAKDLHEIWLQVPPEAWESLTAVAELDSEARARVLDAIAGCTVENLHKKYRDQDVAYARQGDWKSMVAKGIVGALVSGQLTFNKREISQEVVELYEPLLEELRAQRQNPLVHQNRATAALLTAFHQYFVAEQFERGLVRFADVTYRLLRQTRERATLHSAWAEVKHLLLDEFQDTSVAQWSILRPLVGQCQHDAHGSILIVGDAKQAIYGWRGGVAELMETLDREIEELHSEELSTSRRSSQVVLDLVNDVFGTVLTNDVVLRSSGGSEAAERWAKRFVPHETAHPEYPGYTAIHVASEGDSETSDEVVSETLECAAQWIARRVSSVPTATVGVLTQRNQAVARLLSLLRRLGVEASQEGGSSIESSPAVSLMLSWFTWLDHPGDTAAFFHVLRSPLGTLWGLADSATAATRAQQHRRALISKGYAATLRDWVAELACQLEERALDRLTQLIELAHEYDPMASLRTTDFVRFVETKGLEDPKPSGVRVMTVHQSKGLEFDIVVLPELDQLLTRRTPRFIVGYEDWLAPATIACRYCSQEEQKLLPEKVRRAFEESMTRDLVERLCLMYVACTRARYELHAFVAPSKRNEKKIPATSAGLLREALGLSQPLKAATIPWERGDPKGAEAMMKATPPAEERTVTLSPRSSPLARRTVSEPAPSQATRRPLLAELLDKRDAASSQRGTILHRWFREVGWVDDPVPSDDELRVLAAPWMNNALDIDVLLQEFRGALTQEALRAGWARPKGTHELWRERPFVVEADGTLLSGIFDRVVHGRDERGREQVLLIDYKTDRLDDPRAVPIRAERYSEQISLYRRALSSMLHVPEEIVRAELWFVSLGVRWECPLVTNPAD